MKKLFTSADEYIKGCDWKDLALIKFCLRSIGVLIGANLPKKNRHAATAVSAGVFVATYIAIMPKFLKILFSKD